MQLVFLDNCIREDFTFNFLITLHKNIISSLFRLFKANLNKTRAFRCTH